MGFCVTALQWETVLAVLVLGYVGDTSGSGIFAGLCPQPECDCFLDDLGRMEIACLNGQLVDIPSTRMNPSTEVIKIVGPQERPNFLTIGRMFNKFKRLEELYIVSVLCENEFYANSVI